MDIVKLVEARMEEACWIMWHHIATGKPLPEGMKSEWTGDEYPTYGSVKEESD